jgi:tRNA wybutosine-synthesizing protein 1
LGWKEFLPSVKSFDEPKEILQEAIEKRKDLLMGWKGNPNVNKRKFEEALYPTMMTMSLNGEPTLYPKTGQLIAEAKKKGIITFLVTNGTFPEVIEKLDPLPFQLYVSVHATNKDDYVRIARPLTKNTWERLNKTLMFFPSLTTRKVLRFTMIKGWNMKNFKEYVKLITKAEPDYVEFKAYEWVGQSQKRLAKKDMPYINEIEDFANKIESCTGYKIKATNKPSGALLLNK